jgi:hypothetical protein
MPPSIVTYRVCDDRSRCVARRWLGSANDTGDPLAPIWFVGDIHGHYDRLRELLLDAGLVDPGMSWSGSVSHLWFTGDFTDRGPDGIAVVDAVMRLQRETAAAGGFVGSLLGNHDALLVAARRFGDSPSSGSGETFLGDWRANGGEVADLTGLTPAHVEWITGLPAVARVADWLLIHADSLFYTRYGATVDSINGAIRRLLTGADTRAWDRLFGQFAARRAFDGGERGVANAHRLLESLGGRQIIHGHTPIPLMTGEDPRAITSPLVYARGACVNVDAGIYLGSPGFAWHATMDCEQPH